MKKLTPIFSIILICVAIQSTKGQIIIHDQDASNYIICDKWQSLNLDKKVLEFRSDGVYIAYTKGAPGIELHYEVTAREEGLIYIDLFFGEDDIEPAKITIQIVNSDRIRIFVWKHGDVLDLADEYYRTDNFESMHKYLKKIILQNK